MQIYWYNILNYRNVGQDLSFQTEFYLLEFLSLSIGRKLEVTGWRVEMLGYIMISEWTLHHPPFSFQPSTPKPLTLLAFLFCSCWRQRKRYGGSHWPPRTDPSPRVYRQSGQLGGSPAALSPFGIIFTAEAHFEGGSQMSKLQYIFSSLKETT